MNIHFNDNAFYPFYSSQPKMKNYQMNRIVSDVYMINVTTVLIPKSEICDQHTKKRKKIFRNELVIKK